MLLTLGLEPEFGVSRGGRCEDDDEFLSEHARRERVPVPHLHTGSGGTGSGARHDVVTRLALDAHGGAAAEEFGRDAVIHVREGQSGVKGK